MSQQYAKDTTVSVENSRAEIERILRRYKAEAFAYASEGPRASIQFKIVGRWVRFNLTLPDPQDAAFWVYTQGRSTFRRTETEGVRRYEQACRQKWRALVLVIKAKLEAVEAGITTTEDEFLAATVMSDGSTFAEWAQPQIDEMYRLGKMPTSLLALAGPGGKR